MERNVLSLLVANHFGVLTRVTNLFGQRGFNIDSLAVGETENPRFSRITITTHGDERVINQIKLQLAKLEDVKAVVEIPEEQLFIREVVLIKAEPKKAQMEAFEQAVSDFGGRAADRGRRCVCDRAHRYAGQHQLLHRRASGLPYPGDQPHRRRGAGAVEGDRILILPHPCALI